jgi:hypothetical protein
VTLYTDKEVQSTLARKYLVENNISFEEVDIARKGNRITIAKYRLPFLEVKALRGISTVSGFNEFQYTSALNSRLSYDDFVKRKKVIAAKKQMKLIERE